MKEALLGGNVENLGFAIRYLPTSARQTKLRDAAVLVRGVDAYGHFDLFDGPKADLDEAALAAHKDSAPACTPRSIRAPTRPSSAPDGGRMTP